MKASATNSSEAKADDNPSLRDVLHAASSMRIPRLSRPVTAPTLPQALPSSNNVDDASIDGGSHLSSLLANSYLNSASSSMVSLQRTGNNVVLSSSDMSQKDQDEARRRKLVSVIREAMRIIDDDNYDDSQEDGRF